MLKFTTNKRTSPCYGLDDDPIFVLHKEGHKIVGFHGKSSNMLHKLGIHVLPISNSWSYLYDLKRTLSSSVFKNFDSFLFFFISSVLILCILWTFEWFLCLIKCMELDWSSLWLLCILFFFCAPNFSVFNRLFQEARFHEKERHVLWIIGGLNLSASKLQEQYSGVKLVGFDIFKHLFDILHSPSKSSELTNQLSNKLLIVGQENYSSSTQSQLLLVVSLI